MEFAANILRDAFAPCVREVVRLDGDSAAYQRKVQSAESRRAQDERVDVTCLALVGRWPGIFD